MLGCTDDLQQKQRSLAPERAVSLSRLSTAPNWEGVGKSSRRGEGGQRRRMGVDMGVPR